MKNKDSLDGQLHLHWEKVEEIRLFNPLLAEKITDFTNLLIDNNFTGAYDVDDEVYHNGLGVSQSRFQYLKKSPYNYFYNTYKNMSSIKKRPKHFIEGDFIHRVFLERNTVEEMFVSETPILRLAYEAKPDSKNIRATSIYKEKVASYRLDNKEVIRGELFDQMKVFEDYVESQDFLRNIFTNGISEKAFYSLCPDTGLVRKCKTDFIIPADGGMISIIDLKSTANINPDSFEWSIYNYNYHTQGAYYIDTVQKAIDKTVQNYIIFTIEKESPFEFDIGFIDDPSLEAGRSGSSSGYLKFMKTLSECYAKRSFERSPLEIRAYGIPASRMNDELLDINMGV